VIKKFSFINNLAVFDDFEWDKSVLDKTGRPIGFEKINILYGRNYSGKTTLSRILRAMETGVISDKYENPSFSVAFDDGSSVTQSQLSTCQKNIRVFNDDFVKDNLRFISNPQDNIKPFAILGDDNNALEAEIVTLESEVGLKEEGKETGLYAQLKIDSQAFINAQSAYKQASDSLERQITDKATSRATGIKYKSDKFGDQNYNKTKLENEIIVVLSDTYTAIDDEKKLEFEELLSERAKANNPTLSNITLTWEQFCSQAEELATKRIGVSDKIAELLLDASLNEWVKKGCELHKDKRGTCAFCGSPIIDERWKILHFHFDEESKQLEARIEELLKSIETEIKLVKDGFAVDKNLIYSKYHLKIDQLSQSYKAAAENYIAQLNLIIEQMETRKGAITVPFDFVCPKDYSSDLSEVWSEYEELRNQSNDFTKTLNSEQIEAKNALRLQEVFDFVKTIDYDAICVNIEGLKRKFDAVLEKISGTENSIKAKEAQIQDKKRQLNDEEKGAIKVNEYLSNFFGHNFLSLQAVEETDDGEKKIRFEIVRDGKRAFHLSEGECSLIAFCYFMAKLDDIETKETNPIIWIDDPICSLDGNHIFFVYTLIATQIAVKGDFEQLFISTHSLDFLKYLKRLNGKFLNTDRNYSKAYFLIARKGKQSSIQPMPKYMKDYVTEFNYLFQEIYKCSCIETVDDTNYSTFYNFGNNARKFLEIYLFYKYPDFSEDRVKMERFLGEGKVPVIFTERLNNEYSHLGGDIERASMPIEVPEMLSVAKLIINKLKEDEDQYLAFMNSIDVHIPANKVDAEKLVPV
jgi:wobble nucleotide-excising tRNase